MIFKPVVSREVELAAILAFEGRPTSWRYDLRGATPVLTVSDMDDAQHPNCRHADVSLSPNDIAMMINDTQAFHQRVVEPILRALEVGRCPERAKRLAAANAELTDIRRGKQAADYGP